MTGRIVGRDAELAVLSRAVDAAAAGVPKLRVSSRVAVARELEKLAGKAGAAAAATPA